MAAARSIGTTVAASPIRVESISGSIPLHSRQTPVEGLPRDTQEGGGPLVQWRLAQSPATSATIRTTAAPTMLQASNKANVLARCASALIDYRLLPGDSLVDVLAHVRREADDERVGVAPGPGENSEATPTSSVDAAGFKQIADSARAVFPTAVVATALAVPATDAGYYQALSDQVYRFLPIPVTAEDLDRFHGVNERISRADFTQVIAFYVRLAQGAAG